MKDIFSFFEPTQETRDFNAIRISLASPEAIREWSFGEVKKPETINYRTFKPERDGLFCAKIFGPVKDYECNCGKYKRMKHRLVVCEKCGVQVISSKVRRERLGHIELASPVAHIWFLRSLPSRIGNILDISIKNLEAILYCEAYIITDPLGTNIEKGKILREKEYQELTDEFGYGSFRAETGGEAIYELLTQVDIESLAVNLRDQMQTEKNDAKRKKLAKRLKTVNAFRTSTNKAEWMMVKVLPVLPPDLRPLVPLDGGRFATSDLNDLYRRVINRNNRLKKLIELTAPSIIIRNEKRMLQEAVDALFDNGRRSKSVTGTNKRPLKSLSDMLKGKQGRFRQNLLGKRVDYSGRSVIVVGPELRLHQCGLPKKMALELFKPFIYHELEKQGHTTTIKNSKKMVDSEADVIWDILEQVIKEHPVLLNRAPTLHRLGIQAFEPVLIEGKAIQLHPLVCVAFNADFDGDQMAVHVPLSIEAQMEARVLMMSTNNILSPASGKPIIVPTQDIVLGLYYVTRERPLSKGRFRENSEIPFSGVYDGIDEVRMGYDQGEIDLHANIKVRLKSYDDWGNEVIKFFRTTTGRVLVYDLLPPGMPFDSINKVLNKKALAALIDRCYRLKGEKATVLLADNLRTFGYKYSTFAGISIGINDMHIPSKKKEMLREAEEELESIIQQESEGLITLGEKHNKIVDLWSNKSEEVAAEMMKEIEEEVVEDPRTGEKVTTGSFNPIYIMADSGARGSAQQLRQLAGMRGLMAKPSGEIIETPITTNFREGLTVHQYFTSTHGARKGLADTALKTANSGYLTRRLVDVAQDAIVTELDCGTTKGIDLAKLTDGGRTIEELNERILGRVVQEDVVDPYTDEIIVYNNEIVDEEKAERIKQAGIDRVKIRSVLTCEALRGICAYCYGRDLARGQMVQIGEATGTIAAQSIGEPGTQLTMRTFHIGGTALTKGEQSSIEAQTRGTVHLEKVKYAEKFDQETGEFIERVIINRNAQLIIRDEAGREKETYDLVYGAKLLVEDGQLVDKGAFLSEWDPYSETFLAEVDGFVQFEDLEEGQTMSETIDEGTGLSRKMVTESKDASLKPRVRIVDKDGKPKKVPGQNHIMEIRLPAKAYVLVNHKDEIRMGDVLAKLPIETAKMTKDITGGLPRVVELFEARKPKEHAIITEIDGTVSYGPDVKGKQRIIITPPKGESKEYLIPKMKHVKVREGEYVHAGDALMEGPPNPHDILKVLGIERLAKYLVEEIQQVYRVQGVVINDKHIEMIVRMMMRKVKVIEPNDSDFLIDEQVDKVVFEIENLKLLGEGRRPALAEPLLLGITKASLSTESFFAASSFQETTRVLTEAAIWGRVDYLRGLKENVIIGRLLPAGTGLAAYNRLTYAVDTEETDLEDVDDEGSY
ncbi:DNA-directed RNA polymerase subunit beta' [Myxococcota bacterium]|nr:DNA-directed RNA polymerase subunit beta' [Myxococcota bacterium]MBU1382636.1 DNA-directed RNA polymerase subunit beta' [Myxococcota bacterium]MBU1495853.1 DNA-directed RNA polymerase subunit beta' [Myxococcota bacterium]